MMDRANLKQALMELAMALMGLEAVADSLELYDVEADIEAASTMLMAGALKIIRLDGLGIEVEEVQEDHGNS